MESLTSLCDLVAQNPVQFADKLTWICNRCPQPEELRSGSPRVTRSELNNVLAISRFLSKCPDPPDPRSSSLALEFFRSIPASFAISFWPQSSSDSAAVSEFFSDYLGYLTLAAQLSPDFSEKIAGLVGKVAAAAIEIYNLSPVPRAFIVSLSKHFPSIVLSDGERLVEYLLDKFELRIAGDKATLKSCMEAVGSEPWLRQLVAAFEEERLEGLEKQGIAFKLITHVMGHVKINDQLLEKVSLVSKKQLQSLSEFLKIRKQDWNEQGQLLKARVKAKIAVYQAAAIMNIRSLPSPGALSMAAESCSLSVWRKLRICEELFDTLLSGVAQIATSVGGQPLWLLLGCVKSLILAVCKRTNAWGGGADSMFESAVKSSCQIIESGWPNDRAAVKTFISGLILMVDKDKPETSVVQLNVICLLADVTVAVYKSEVVDMILPFFIEILEDRASIPSLLRLRLLGAVSQIASLGSEKSYRETVVLMIRCYVSAVRSAESKTLAPAATSECVETLPAGFLLISSGLKDLKLRADYRHRLLSLCSDVSLESKSERNGAEFLGPLLPAVAQICSDFDPTANVEPSLLKLFRNLWFCVALFGLAPSIQKVQQPAKATSTSTNPNSFGSVGSLALQAVVGPYMWNMTWASAVQRIAQGTPPLVFSSVKWLEDNLELNALYNPGSGQGSGNEKAAVSQRGALAAALGWHVEVKAMSTISGVNATYLLAVAFLEILRFTSNGGTLNGGTGLNATRSAFSCAFEYLRSPDLMPSVFECLMTIVHRAFEAAIMWLEDRATEMGHDADTRELTLSVHACFLIKSMSQREKHIRDISVKLLTQLRDKFPQILWHSSCLDSLLFYFTRESTPSTINGPTWIGTVRPLYQRVLKEWISISISRAPCTTQGLLQLCKAETGQRTQPTTYVISLITKLGIDIGKNGRTGIGTANIPAVMVAAVAASGVNLKLTEALNSEVLSNGIVGATIKCKHAGEIAGLKRLYRIDGFQSGGNAAISFDGLQWPLSGAFTQPPQAEDDSLNEMLLNKFVQLLQKFVNTGKKGEDVDKVQFCDTCCQATALILANLASESRTKGFSQLLHLLCWCPAYLSTTEAMETGVFIWTWLVSSSSELGSLVLAKLVDAWRWTIVDKRGLFASQVKCSGPAATLRPQLSPGEPESHPEVDPVEQIMAHRLWLGFFIDRFEVVRHNSVDQLLLFERMLQETTESPRNFSRHPSATGTFFTLMLLGLKFYSQGNLRNMKPELQLLEDRIYRACLGWFAFEPEWYDVKDTSFAQNEAQSVSVFLHYLYNMQAEVSQSYGKGQGQENVNDMNGQVHPVWGHMENYNVGREKRKQLLIMLCQYEADRLEVWAQPTNSKDNTAWLEISSDKWVEYARTAFSVDPGIAISLVSRFPTNFDLADEVTNLVQSHITDMRCIAEALPYVVTPEAVEEDSVLLQQLPHWAACSITQALEFLAPAYKGHARVMAYVLRVLESYPPERVTFFMPQLVQALRYDKERLVQGYLLRAAQRSDIFAHFLIWHLQGETSVPEEVGKDAIVEKNSSFQLLLPEVRQHIIDGLNPRALDLFQREFNFFYKVTSISGVLLPLPKEEHRAGIRKELEKIEMEGDDLYLPTAPNKLVRGIVLDSGIPLQSAAKVPILVAFNVVDRDGDPDDIQVQGCIFKVGDDCRQDVLALQVIALLKDIFEAVGINLYLYPYSVLPTGPGRGIIEVVPNTRSRSQMGETTDGGLYEIFQQDYGPVGSPSFEAARENFVVSSAGYAVASLLLQPKDRHNGNLLFDNVGRLVHIDFGFILGTSPGRNMRFESAHFKLSHEMTQLLDPSGDMKSDTWIRFVSLCVKGYLAARRNMDGIISTVMLMLDSGLPCFSRRHPIGNLRKRFHPEMSDREAANFMIRVCANAYNKWTTAGYDLIQYLQQGIEK